MAITKVPQASRLVVKVQTGVNATGNPVYRLRSFQNLKPGAADADIHAIGQALVGLQKYPAVNIGRVDESNLINQ